MTTYELIRYYDYRMTANITIQMRTSDGDDLTIFNWTAEDNRHPDDGSYANVLSYIPNDIANAVVESFDVIPQHIVSCGELIKLSNTETLYITIPSYSNLYRYLEDDNYPFL